MLTVPGHRLGLRSAPGQTLGGRSRLHLWRRRRRVRVATRSTTIPRRGRRRVLEPNSTKRDGVISKRGWKREFEYPIPLPRGRQLITLEDAARYIQKLPKAEQQLEEWQTAIEVLILVAESSGGPTMMARIGVMRALNRNVERVFNSSRKDTHWGKRKLARDR
jgi:hypothetical protein